MLFESQTADLSMLSVASFIVRVLICELFPEIAALGTENLKRLSQFAPSVMENRYSYNGTRGLGVPRLLFGN